MKEKYTNIFENVDTGSINSTIDEFINSLNSVDYGSTGCFPMSTNAKYDTTFDEGFTELKNTDIQGMIDLCNKCKTQIINKIISYKEYYNGTYTSSYNSYTTKYNTWNNMSDNSASKLIAEQNLQAAIASLEKCEEYLKSLENQIQGAF